MFSTAQIKNEAGRCILDRLKVSQMDSQKSERYAVASLVASRCDVTSEWQTDIETERRTNVKKHDNSYIVLRIYKD